MFYVDYEHFPVDNVFFIRVLKYDFPIIPKSVEVILAWSKAISHENSQNSRIPGIPGGGGWARVRKYDFPIIPKSVEVILP